MRRAYFHLTYKVNTELPAIEQINHNNFRRWIGCNLLHYGFLPNQIQITSRGDLIFCQDFDVEDDATFNQNVKLCYNSINQFLIDKRQGYNDVRYTFNLTHHHNPIGADIDMNQTQEYQNLLVDINVNEYRDFLFVY